jgi:hypothetical protein
LQTNSKGMRPLRAIIAPWRTADWMKDSALREPVFR